METDKGELKYTQVDLDFFSDNADDYFAKMLEAQARLSDGIWEFYDAKLWRGVTEANNRAAAAEARVEAAGEVIRLAKELAHEHPDEPQWGYDAAGIHTYEPDEPRGCTLCAALDAALAGREETGE